MGYVIFNGKSSADFGLEVETFPTYDIPERNYDTVNIPGRNGDFLIDLKTYKNVNRQYKVSIATSERGKLGPIDTNRSYTQVVNRIAEWLNSPNNSQQPYTRSGAITDETAMYLISSIPGYSRLEDSYEPDYYRMAYFKSALSIENIVDEAGRVTIAFNCMPQRFLKEGEKPILLESSAQFLTNKTNFIAKPVVIFEKVAAERTDIDFDFYYDSDNPEYADDKHTRIGAKYRISVAPISVPSIMPGETPTVRMMVDCDTQNALGLDNPLYYLEASDGNLNKYVSFEGLTGECPVLEPGITQIHFTRDTKIKWIKIYPRWYTI